MTTVAKVVCTVSTALLLALGCDGGKPSPAPGSTVDVAAHVAHYRLVASQISTLQQFALDPKLVELLLDVEVTRETVKQLLADKSRDARGMGVMIAAASGDSALHSLVSRLYMDAKTDAEMGRINAMGEYTVFAAAMRLNRHMTLDDLILLQAKSSSREYSLPGRAADFLKQSAKEPGLMKRWYHPCLCLTYVPATGIYTVEATLLAGYDSIEVCDRAAALATSGRLPATKAQELWFRFGDDRVAELAAHRLTKAIAYWRHRPDFLHGPANDIAKMANYYRNRRDPSASPYLILALELARKGEDSLLVAVLRSALESTTRGRAPDDPAEWRSWYEMVSPGSIARAEKEVEKALAEMRARHEIE